MSGPTESIPAETAYAKLNLALHVRRRRPDGYHDIQTVFAFCEDGDRLSAKSALELTLEVTGPFAGDVPLGDDNLVIRAASALKPGAGARLRLIKAVPVASGIGGGSADAAAALRLLTKLWGMEGAGTESISRSLGADVPACLSSLPARGEAAGDEVTPIALPELAGKPVLLINPRVPLATADVFARWDGVDRGPLGDWRDGRNDLEPAAIALVPEIAGMLKWLRDRPGAEFVRISGSGATCFGLFDTVTTRDAAAAAVGARWWHMATRLR